LHANGMLNLGMLYFNSDRRLTAPDVLDPLIVSENPQSLSDRLVDAAALTSTVCLTSLRSKQETLHVFKATTTIYHFRFSFARVAQKNSQHGESMNRGQKKKRTIEGGGSLLNARFFNSPIAREEFAIELFQF
jgi:hypothetical protein